MAKANQPGDVRVTNTNGTLVSDPLTATATIGANGRLIIESAGSLNVEGGTTIFLEGVMLVTSVGHVTTLHFTDSTVLAGNGLVDLGNGNAFLTADLGEVVTFQDTSLTGHGTSNAVIATTGTGSVHANDVNRTLNLSPMGGTNLYQTDVGAGPQGTLKLSGSHALGVGGGIFADGGHVNITNATVALNGNDIDISDQGGFAGSVTIANSTVTDGTITSTGAGGVTVSGTSTLTNVVIDSNVTQSNGAILSTDQDVQFSKTWTIAPVNVNTGFDLAAAVTLRGGGTWDFRNATLARIDGAPGASATLDDGLITGAGRISIPLAIQNQGKLVADRTGGWNLLGPLVNDTEVVSQSGAGVRLQAGSTGTGNFRISGSPLNVDNASELSTTGFVTIESGANLNVNGGKVTASVAGLAENAALVIASSLVVEEALVNQMTSEANWNVNASTGVIEMTGGVGAATGDWAAWSRLEVAGTDEGNVPGGFTSNFEIPELRIGPGAQVLLRDLFDNGNRGGPVGAAEALYVDELVFSDGAGLINTAGPRLYYNTLVGNAGQILDVPAAEPPPGPSNLFTLGGTAAGGSVTIFVEGIEITVVTTAGETAGQVLQALADAVNAHPTLDALGISAQVVGSDLVVTGGEITDSSIDDPGLDGTPAVDALSRLSTVLLVVLLAAAAAIWLRRGRLAAA